MNDLLELAIGLGVYILVAAYMIFAVGRGR